MSGASKWLARIGLQAFLAIYLCSCAARTHPTLAGLVLEGSARVTVVRALVERDQALRSFRGLAHARMILADGVSSFRQVVAFTKPDRLRIEAIPTNAAVTLNMLVVLGEKVTLLDAVQKQALQGNDAERLIKRHTKIPVPPAALMSLVSAVVPEFALRSGEDELRLFHDPVTRTYTLVRGDFVEYYRFDDQSFVLKDVELRNRFNDQLVVALHYASPRAELSGASDVEIQLPDEKATLSLTWTNYQPNAVVPDKIFEVQLPADFAVYGG